MTEKTLNHGHQVTGDDSWLSYLCEATPEILWYHLESEGDYQGEVYAIGKYQSKCLIFSGSYGSCSGCGAWGEGGEPENLQDVLNNSAIFDDIDEAITAWGHGQKGVDAICAILDTH